MDRWSLSPLVSYRCLDDWVIVVDHQRRELLRLNRAAGRVLAKLERPEARFDREELEFLEVLAQRGLVTPGDDGSTDRATAAAPPSATPSAEPARAAFIDRLNARAAELLVPLHCQLELTYRCALSCRYCYLASERSAVARELSTAEVTALLDDLAELGGLFLLLTGGEIFLRDDLERIVDHARRLRFAVTLLTSGFGMDRATMGRLATGGIDCVQISLHGADPTTHDEMTGTPGSFAAALEAMRVVRDLNVRTQAAITVTTKNAASLDAMLSLLADEGIAPNLSHYVEPLRDGSTASQDLLLDEEALRRVEDRVPSGGNARLAGRALDDHPCGAGASTLAVDPRGQIYPCHTLRHPVGSLRRNRIGTIWRESEELRRIRSIRVADLDDCPSCGERDWCNRCAGFALAEGRGLLGHSLFDCLQARVVASKNRRTRESSRP